MNANHKLRGVKLLTLLPVIATALLASQSHGVIVAQNERSDVVIPVSLGGVNIQPTVLISAAVVDYEYDPATALSRPVNLGSFLDESDSQPLARTLDTSVDLSGSGFEGTAGLQAGGNSAAVEMNIASINVDPEIETRLSSYSVEYQTLRFSSVTDTEIDITASYLLSGSANSNSQSSLIRGPAISALQIFDLDSFQLTREENGSLVGTADYAIYDVLSVLSGSQSIDNTVALRAKTNRNYLVVLNAWSFVRVYGPEDATVGVSAMASIDPVFSVLDPNISIERSFVPTAQNPVPVPQPDTLGLLGLGLLSLCFARRKRIS